MKENSRHFITLLTILMISIAGWVGGIGIPECTPTEGVEGEPSLNEPWVRSVDGMEMV